MSKETYIPCLLALFRQYGYDGATLSKISQATGLGKASLYHHFPGGKDEMVEAVLGFIERWLNDHIVPALHSDGDPATRFRRMCDFLDEFYDGGRQPCLFAILLMGSARDVFHAKLEGFYLGTVGSNGYPYIQFRGGAAGFLKVLDEKTLGFADFSGNVQYITVGNLSANNKAFLFLMDYRHRRRIKLWGQAEAVEGDPDLIDRLRNPEDPSEIERAILFHVEAISENCPQHIPIRYSEAEVLEREAALQARIAELENQIKSLSV